MWSHKKKQKKTLWHILNKNGEGNWIIVQLYTLKTHNIIHYLYSPTLCHVRAILVRLRNNDNCYIFSFLRIRLVTDVIFFNADTAASSAADNNTVTIHSSALPKVQPTIVTFAAMNYDHFLSRMFFNGRLPWDDCGCYCTMKANNQLKCAKILRIPPPTRFHATNVICARSLPRALGNKRAGELTNASP